MISIIRGFLISNDTNSIVIINDLSNYGRFIAKDFSDVSRAFNSISEKSTRIIVSVNAGNPYDMSEYRNEVLNVLDRILELL